MGEIIYARSSVESELQVSTLGKQQTHDDTGDEELLG